MYDLLTIAYQADLTRVFTFMSDRELSQRTYPQIGVTEQHHTVSHHGNDPENIAKVAKINTYHVELFAKFLDKLRATPDGDGSLLDHSLIFYGGGMGNPNQHASDPLPLIAVGGGVGTGHRHIKLPTRTPVGNLWMAVAKRYGSPIARFGESNGRGGLLRMNADYAFGVCSVALSCVAVTVSGRGRSPASRPRRHDGAPSGRAGRRPRSPRNGCCARARP